MSNTVRCPQPPGSTYRLQLTGDFGFAAAARQAGYLARLGVTHVYLSPILQAVPGSRHGYDVTDHSRVSADLGGEDGFRAMVATFRSAGLGVVVDIVPNHMAIPAPETLNHQLWSVLRSGPESEYAHWFDIDWDAGGGRMLLPILTSPVLTSEIPDGLTADGDVLRYCGHVLPLREGTQRLPMPRLLDAQHYRLAHWRDAATQLNWRRFFDITTLIGLRAEDPRVFGATHEVIVRLVAEGLIDGLRVDHPDGLADPSGYLRRLADATGVWIVAEKILAAWEDLPDDWECAGTTGYDTLALVDGLFIDPDGEEPLNSEYARFTQNKTAFAAVARDAKREVARASFAAEMSQLARLLAAPAADAHEVLAELAACLHVYRAYAAGGKAPPQRSVRQIGDALAAAKSGLPARLHGLADAARNAALGTGPAGSTAPAEFAVRFGQLTAPVQAKGVEDTACYRWSRLVAANEVGSDPGRMGVSVATFHAEASRLASHWPATMTTLSTHDTKRAEDVRARLAVLAERPGEWAEAVAAWHLLMPESVLDPDTEYLLWQTLVGAWPIESDRLREYLTKAMREAKTRTSWTDPDPVYESAALEFAERARQVAPVGDFVRSIEPDARVNSLGAKLVQLTMPGVPDVYQGCELESLALVDPDNRRAVDFARRQELVDAIDQQDNPDQPGKLVVTTRALRLRRDNPGWFAGGAYTPLRAEGPAAGHVVAFARGANAVTVATRLPAGLRRRGGWADTVLPLPAAPGRRGAGWTDVLTGAEHEGPRPSLAALTRRLPVALLTPR